MTTLELILIGIIWIAYGVFSAYQYDKANPKNKDERLGNYIIMTIAAPLVFLLRALHGIFSITTVKE